MIWKRNAYQRKTLKGYVELVQPIERHRVGAAGNRWTRVVYPTTFSLIRMKEATEWLLRDGRQVIGTFPDLDSGKVALMPLASSL